MKIGIIATHSFPIKLSGTVTKTGDIVIVDLVRTLDEMGHSVCFCAPEGSYEPPNGKYIPMRPSFGKYPPSSEECEQEAYTNYGNFFKECSAVHDFSVTKVISKNLYAAGYKNLLSTLMGGAWNQTEQPHNLVVWSKSHRDRVMRGATDYENTPTPDLAGPNGTPVDEASIVHGGIDTDFYCPTDYKKDDFYLWMNRWHTAKGYKNAIDLAKKTGIKLVLSGEHPDNELFEYQRYCALEAVELAKGHDNITFQWLPKENIEHHIEKRDLYRRARALLYTVNFNEPFGLSQTESLACGTPVIGTNYGSVPEVIQDGLTGYVRNNDIDEFAKALSLVDKIDPKICREEAVKCYDRKIMANNYLKKYEEISAGKGWDKWK